MQVSRLGLVCLYARLHLENFHENVNPQPQKARQMGNDITNLID